MRIGWGRGPGTAGGGASTEAGGGRGGPRPPVRPPALAAAAALRLHRLLLRAADAVLPPEFVLFERTVADARARMLAAVAELGVADLLDGPRTAADLAADLRGRGVPADADVLHRVMRALVLDGVFRLDRRGRFTLTAVGRRLRADHPASLLPVVRYWSAASTRRAWDALPEVVATGTPGFVAAHGRSVWDWFAEHPQDGRVFADAMRRLTEVEAADVVALHAWPEHGVVCDVAGGAGTLLAALLSARPGLRGVLVESAGVLVEADRLLTRHGVRDRVELVEGDLLGGFAARADRYVLKTVLHDWDDATCAAILARVRAAMPDGAVLVVADLVQPRDRAAFPASLVDVQMAVVCDAGRERSLAEQQALLRAAGFTPGAVRRSGTGMALISATAS